MVTVIKNGTIVTDTSEYLSDVKIEHGTITAIGSFGDIVGAEVINASGSFLLPGFVDPHTHVDMGSGQRKTADNWVSGSKAAIAGGTTTIIDFITQTKGDTLLAALEEWHQKADNQSFCDYGFHMGIIDWNDDVRQEMSTMVKEGVTSFKMYMAYREVLQVNDQVIYEALKESEKLGTIIGFHCENGDMIEALIAELVANGKTSPYYHQLARPEIVETEAIYRLTQLAKLAESSIWIVHLSTAKGLEIIHEMRAQGTEILVETCPQYLVLDATSYGSPKDTDFEAAKFVMSPPLRQQSNQHPLWDALAEGTIEMVTSDHCPFNWKVQKELGRHNFSQIPSGAPGVEHRMPLLYSYGVAEGKMTLSQMVKIGATNPAKTFGLRNKGSIEVGKDADIVIFDPKGESTISANTQTQHVDYTPYEGMKRHGHIQQVLLRGKTVLKDGIFYEAPTGQYQSRGPYTPL